VNALELWAGPECSFVRVGERYIDQLGLTGHARRADDVDRLAALGVRAVRQPVLWERTDSWAFADERLGRLRELGLRPIVGLVHHGSGPRHTNLLDDGFVSGLAGFARSVAERYPWLRDFTPVNEPLTTARFSALYGHWYPHAQSDHAFVRALIVECLATRAAMDAVRAVIPDARLVQTEDLGTVYATPRLAYQARFENQRRFLSLDLLCGKVDAAHPLHDWLLARGADIRVLASFVEAPCVPALIGLNYYVTSDRFLDDAVANYPADAVGGNGVHAYADVEAGRARSAGITGHAAQLETLWQRYHLPLAITEAHLACSPDEQARWLYEAWCAAKWAQSRSIPVRAVTAWAAFGAYDWDSLLTAERGHYEAGLFEVREGLPVATPLALVARDLAVHGDCRHALLDCPGWWRRPERLTHRAMAEDAASA